MFGVSKADRPTATTTIKTAEEGQQPLEKQLERYRGYLADIMLTMLCRDQQFFPAGVKQYDQLMGGSFSAATFSMPTEAIERLVLIQTKASTATLNESIRKQEIVALVERMEKAYDKILGYMQAATDPMNPIAPAALQLAKGYVELLNRMLEAFQVARRNQILPQDVEREVLDARAQRLQAIVEQQNAIIQQLEGALGVSGGPGTGGAGGGDQAPGGAGREDGGPPPPTA
jgi:hypothetical protein